MNAILLIMFMIMCRLELTDAATKNQCGRGWQTNN